MSEASQGRTYASMMTDSLKKKESILKNILEITKAQATLLKKEDMDADEFNELTDKKGECIDELEKLDSGFDQLYKRLESDLMSDRDAYIDDIENMKGLIRSVTDLGNEIQVIEKRNYELFSAYISGERMKLKKANVSRKTAKNYAQNMMGARKDGASYFINESK